MNKNKAKAGRQPPPKDIVKAAFGMLLNGDTDDETVCQLKENYNYKITARTLNNWKNRYDYFSLKSNDRDTIDTLHAAIVYAKNKLKKAIDSEDDSKITRATNNLERVQKLLQRTQRLQHRQTQISINQTNKKPAIKQRIHHDLSDYVYEKIINENILSLLPYQKLILLANEQDNPLIYWEKSRQIGGSRYTAAAWAILKTFQNNCDTIIISASLPQSTIILGQVKKYLDLLELNYGKPDAEKMVGVSCEGLSILIGSTNFSTIQGNKGNVVADEIAWLPPTRAKNIIDVLLPNLTHGGQYFALSSPSFIGTTAWEICTNYKNKYPEWTRFSTDIHDAVNDGLELPYGGIDRLRRLAGEQFPYFYENKWFSGSDSIFNWEKLCLISKTGEDENTQLSVWDGPCFMGIDVGFKHKTSIFVIGYDDSNPEQPLRALTYKAFSQDIPDPKGRQATIESMIIKFNPQVAVIDAQGTGNELAWRLKRRYQCVNLMNTSVKHWQEMINQASHLVDNNKIKLFWDVKLFLQLMSIKQKMTARGIGYEMPTSSNDHGDIAVSFLMAIWGIPDFMKGQSMRGSQLIFCSGNNSYKNNHNQDDDVNSYIINELFS